jgi:hypothetical protein
MTISRDFIANFSHIFLKIEISGKINPNMGMIRQI